MENATPVIPNLTEVAANITSIPAVSGPQNLFSIIFNPGWIITSIIILLIAYGTVRVMDISLRFLAEQLGIHRHVPAMLIPFLKILIYLFSLYLILSPILRLELTELAVLSGLVGAGIGFGLKDIVADIVAGLTLILEKPYQIGDKIDIDGNYGEVVDIGLTQTIIITPNDNRVAIPNYLIFTRSVTSATAGSTEMMVVTELFISYESDVHEAVRLLSEAIITSRYVFVSDEHPYVILIENHPFYRTLKAKAYVNDLRQEFVFKSDITSRAWLAFEDAGITPPSVSGMMYPSSLN